MSLDTIMNMSITVESRSPAQAGFGTPMLFGYHEHNLGQLVKQYAQADDMLDDGFSADDALYKAAQIVKSQNPCPDVFKVARRVEPLTQVIELEPLNTTEGYKYKGTIGGKTLSYTVLADADLSSVAIGLINAINALDAGTTASGDGAATVTSDVGPWELVSGQTLKVAVDADVPGSPDTATFTAAAASQESATETWDFTGGKLLTVSIDGGSAQTITFINGDFVDPAVATAEEVGAVISAQITGAQVSITSSGTKVKITSDTKGTDSGVEVTGGTANALLGFSTSLASGTGNVGNIAAVTYAEAKTIIEAATDASVSNSGGALKLSSSTTGTSSKVDVDATSTATGFGFDNDVHTGENASAIITCTADDPGVVVSFDWLATTPPKYMGMKDVTVDTTTDNEIPVVNAEDDAWYGLMIIDSSSTATALNAAGWIETKRKLCVVQSGDTDCLNQAEETDTMTQLKDSSYARTGCIWHRGIGGAQWLAAGWFAGALTTTPGAATMAFKEVKGVKVDKLESGEEASILLKNGSHYTDVGLFVTFEGKSGAGEFMDTVRFIDWVYARMRENVLLVLANNPKIPFTDNGVDTMRLAISSVIEAGIVAGGFAKDPPYTVSAPKVAAVSAANRIARTLPDLTWTAQLAGAIHRLVPVTGRVSV